MKVCDVCGAPTDRDAIRVGWDLVTYEVDLCDDHAEALIEVVESILPSARRLGAPPTSAPLSSPKPVPARERVSTSEVRAWAKKQGIQVSDRGRIPEEVFEQYLERER
jgi:hypothetical protein